MDWSRFVNAWRREERIERDTKLQSAAATASSTSAAASATPSTRLPTPQHQPNVNNDAVVKASTDQLSTVFDWLIDQIPASAKSVSVPSSANAALKAPEKVVDTANEMVDELMKKAKARAQEQDETKTKSNGSAKTNELESKEDLERFYVALSRKIYDEGL